MDKISTVDFSIFLKNENPPEEEWRKVASQIFQALSGIGFVYISNHRVPMEVIDKAFEESRRFFELPQEIKMQSLKDISKSFNGYAAAGQETLHPDSGFELRESYDVCGNLRYFPSTTCPNFGKSLEDLETATKPLIKRILKVMALAMNLEDPDFFVNRSKNLDNPNIPSFTTFRSLYYPKVWNNDKVTAGTVRCADHTDYGILTVLYQDSIGGLEVKAVNGDWVQAKPIENTVLINTGDLLEFWSGGVFPATHHRVLIPEEEIRKKCCRQSIVYFTHPDDEVIIKPLREDKDSGNKYEAVTAGQHAQMRLKATYNY